jgi:hypothetical protein
MGEGGEAYQHYRNGDGEDWEFDYEKACADDNYVQLAVEGKLRLAQEWAEQLAGDMQNGSSEMTGSLVSARNYSPVDAFGQHLYPAKTENW